MCGVYIGVPEETKVTVIDVGDGRVGLQAIRTGGGQSADMRYCDGAEVELEL
ncbi:uncharacterized protein G2W53_001453 [Senna tora]|uniref:Uncharacterized protein n=1 Tax=Senna tora TaxID=362788 RepID=A0A834XH75_9FABA|nr:uncharacterized protein G2W53_001453 [Senna tora]